jgi:cytosine permease
MFGYMLAQNSPVLSVIAFAFLLFNLGSVCSHCLYNSAVGWSRISNGKMRVAAVILAVVGIVIAAANVWALFIPWLSLLGVVVPPIGAIILVDLYLLRPGTEEQEEWRFTALAAWAIGSAVALVVEKNYPQLSTAFSAFIAGAIAYWVISSNTGKSDT